MADAHEFVVADAVPRLALFIDPLLGPMLPRGAVRRGALSGRPAAGDCASVNPSTGLRASPSTGLRASPSTGLRASPSTGLRASPSTGLRASPSAGLTWPHHFDIATLIELPKTPSGKTPTIGVGLSPGDESYHEPYWYVGPNPRPDVSNAPNLGGGGRWHTAGWIGAALPASDFVDAQDQRAQVKLFVESAVKECRKLLQAQTG